MHIEKKQLRQLILTQRSILSETEVKNKSLIIVKKLTNLTEYKESSTVMCYVDFKNEVQTRDFINICLKDGKRAAVPLVVRGQHRRELWACEIFSLEDLEAGSFGIHEPRADRIRKIKPVDIDMVIVPGAAFDIRRQRIGYGSGYYDLFLSQTREDCFKAGIAFDFQVLDKIPSEAHDIVMNVLLTESRAI